MFKLFYILLITYTSLFGQIEYDTYIQNDNFKNQIEKVFTDFQKENNQYYSELKSLEIKIELTPFIMNGYYYFEEHKIVIQVPKKMYKKYVVYTQKEKKWYESFSIGLFDSYEEDFNDYLNNCLKHELTHSIGGNEFYAAKSQNRLLNNKELLNDLNIYFNTIYMDDSKLVTLFNKHLEKYLVQNKNLDYMFLFSIENLSKIFTGSILLSNSRISDAEKLYVNYTEYSSIILKKKNYFNSNNNIGFKSDIPLGIIHNIFMNIKENGNEIDFENILLSKMLEDFYLQTNKYFKSYEEYIIMCNETKELVEYKYKLEREKYIM